MMKKLVVGLVIGLVVGGGSIAIAQTTTTSADFCVKDNGKIRLTLDGTCEAGEQLLTIEGAQGLPGLPGQDGADGQDGVDGVSGYEIVRLDAEWGGGGLQRDAYVYCPPGKKVLGSGWGLLGAYTAESGDIDQNSMYWNEPMAAGDGWHFQVAGDFSGPVRTYELYIFCADV